MTRKIDELAFFTEQVDAVRDFYATVLGAGPKHTGDGLAMFDVSGATLLVHHTYEPKEGDLPPDDHFALGVDDLEATCEDLKATGLDIDGPRDFPWGRSAYLRDPDGRLVELHQARSDNA